MPDLMNAQNMGAAQVDPNRQRQLLELLASMGQGQGQISNAEYQHMLSGGAQMPVDPAQLQARMAEMQGMAASGGALGETGASGVPMGQMSDFEAMRMNKHLKNKGASPPVGMGIRDLLAP